MATSVVNRIMNVYDDLPPRPQPGMPATPDATPAPALDAAIQAPKPAVDATPEVADAIGTAPLLK